MDATNNRAIAGMEEWLQREQNIARLFSPATLQTKYFQELKLDYLHELYNKIHPDATKDERITLRILKGEMSALEKRLYSSAIVRLFKQIGRELKEIFRERAKPDFGQRTSWMLKVDTGVLRPAQQNKNVNTMKQARQQPVLVQKNRVALKKGLKIK